MPDCDLDRSVTFCLQRSVPNRGCNSENTPILQYSITPLLHYSITPLLRSAGFEDEDETDLTQ